MPRRGRVVRKSVVRFPSVGPVSSPPTSTDVAGHRASGPGTAGAPHLPWAAVTAGQRAHFIIWVANGDVDHAHVAAVPSRLADWLLGVLDPLLLPLSDEQYLATHCVIPFGASRWSYVVTDEAVHWIVEDESALIVTRFDVDGSMWSASFPWIRKRLDEEDDDEPDLAYDLVFYAWDSQFEAFWREHRGFLVDDGEVERTFDLVMQHVQELQAAADRDRADSDLDDWADLKLDALETWAAHHTATP